MAFIAMAALFALALLLLRTEGFLEKDMARYISLLALAAAFGLRLWLLCSPPTASESLETAAAYFRAAGGFWGLREYEGPLSVPAQFFLALFSYAPGQEILLYKCVCVFFEVTAAWSCQRCVQSISSRSAPRLAAFLLVLLLPSGIYQGAAVGSGESLWWVFLVLAAAVGLQGKAVACAAGMAAAVAFSPYALFLLPVFWVFPALRRSFWRSVLLLPAFYILILLPVLLLGRLPEDTLPFYPAFSRIFSAPAFQGLPGLYSLREGWPSVPVGMLIYGGVLLLMLWRLAKLRIFRDKRGQLAGLTLAALSAGAFLPYMPAQGLYGAELFLLMLCCAVPPLIPAAGCCCFASLTAVLQNVYGSRAPFPSAWGSLALFTALVFLLAYLITHAAGAQKTKKPAGEGGE